MKGTPLAPRLLDVHAAAAYLGGVSVWTIRAWVADKHLQPVRLPSIRKGERAGEHGRRLLFDVRDLDAFVETSKARA
jgi:hypothetical protein